MDGEQQLLEAERARLEAALAERPGDAELLDRLGRVCQGLGDNVAAARHLAQAAALRPDWDAPRYHLAIALELLGRHDDAVTAYRAALELNPRHAEAHVNLANILTRRWRIEEALRHYNAAILVRPDWQLALLNKANALAARGDLDAARQEYEKVLRLGGPEGVRLRRDLQVPIVPRSAEEYRAARQRYEAALAALEADPPRIEDPAREGGGNRFYLAYYGLDDRPLQERLARLYLAACPELAWTAPHCAAGGRRHGRRRIAFVSRFFFDHSIGRLMRGLLSHLAAREDCEILLFDVTAVPDDALRRELVALADRVERLPGGLADRRLAIARHEPDILFYPDIGMDHATYFLAFARLAPVQCVAYGHPVTTGIPTIDYYLSCDAAEPPGAEAHYSEKLVRLGGLPFSYARPARPEPMKSRAAFGLAEDETLYFLAQNPFKIHPDMDAALRGILEGDPRGRVLLLEGNEPRWGERLRERLRETLGSAFARVTFLARQEHADYMRLLALADVGLDSFPFCGGNTTYQALAMGTPVVTLPGKYLRGRVTLAIYRRMGVEDCGARDVGDSVRIALRLGTDREWAAKVRRRIEAGCERIFDDPVFLEEAERFLMTVEPPPP